MEKASDSSTARIAASLKTQELLTGSRQINAANKSAEQLQAPQALNTPRSLTPQGYAEAVTAHAKQDTEASLYPGHNFENFASFLLRPFEETHSTYGAQKDFPVTQYDFCMSKPKQRYTITTPEDLARKREDALQSVETNSTSILFLRGQPSASWLSAIGAKYYVDPEYFQRHLDFRSIAGRLNYFPLPSLPSSSAHLIKLRYTTILQSGKRKGFDQATIDSLRLEGTKAFDRYMHSVNQSIEKNIGSGDSIVRAYNVHDETHFSIEQDISIYMNRTTSGPICLVWLDTGNDLTHGPEGPWFTSEDRHIAWPSIIVYPTIQHQPQVSLKSHRTSIDRDARRTSSFAQSSSLLHLDYGKLHDSSLMACDPFYALDELFKFCANSEIQLLNLIESKLSRETGYALLSSGQNSQLSNLLYNQDILDEHEKRLRDNIEIIRVRGGLKWPRASQQDMEQKAEAAANAILKDYEYLLSRTVALSERCRRGMTVIMSNATIAESKRAIAQAEEVTKLTRLAFLFIPVSFTTSFFGMNLAPVVGGTYSLWLWALTSIPIMVVSIVALLYDVSALARRSVSFAQRVLRRLRRQ
ncbi:hypothetical protein MMC17_005527 [Xylographa soralifera]|nr:hypothetical protein [Xylographa soralifera]